MIWRDYLTQIWLLNRSFLKSFFFSCDSVVNNPTYSCAVFPDSNSQYPDCCPKPLECGLNNRWLVSNTTRSRSELTLSSSELFPATVKQRQLMQKWPSTQEQAMKKLKENYVQYRNYQSIMNRNRSFAIIYNIIR